MAKFLRRNAAAVAMGALALTLMAGGIAAAAPTSRAGLDASQTAARPDNGSAGQPAVGTAEARQAREALVPATTAGLAPTAQTFFAVVGSNGALARGFQAVSATRLATGQYQVVFSHDISRSAFVATLGLTGSLGISPPGEIAVVGRTGLANAVFVQTWNSAGVPTNRSFHLAVLS